MSTVSVSMTPSAHDMSDSVDNGRAAAQGIDGRAALVYRYATRHGALDSLEAAAAELCLSVPEILSTVAGLVDLRLLRTDAASGGHLVPTDPEVAAALLISPIERAMYERREISDQLRDRIDAITRSQDVVTEPVGAIDGLEGVAEIRGLFKLAAETCRDELLILRPHHHDEDLLDELLDPCYAVLDRDVSVRLVCPHRSRAGFASRAKAKRLIEGGAQIRTLSHIPQAAVVFDRSLTVMLNFPEPGRQPTARRVRDRNVAQFLVNLSNQLWDSAAPFETAEPGYADTTDDLHQAIVRLMAQGLTDDVVARRLGMSVRTCRRHIAAVFHSLGSVSRFQAGVHAATRFTINGSPLPE